MKKTIIILSALTLVSCGARKTSKSETEVKTEVKTEAKDTLVKNTEVKKTETYLSVTDELEIKPIDTAKAIEIIDSNGKITKFKNAVLKRKSKQDNKTTATETKVVENASKTAKNEVKQTTKEQTKQTDKKPVSFWDYFWIVLLLILLVLIYRFYKKYVEPKL